MEITLRKEEVMGQNMAKVFKYFSDDVKALNPQLFGPLGVESHAQLKEKLATAPARKNKYNAERVNVNGYTFDSKKEANRYLELRAQLEAGTISNLLLQCEIHLMEGFTYKGEKIRGIKYTADFVYQKEGKTYIEDVKSVATARTEAFRIRWRLLQWMYRDVEDVVLLLID